MEGEAIPRKRAVKRFLANTVSGTVQQSSDVIRPAIRCVDLCQKERLTAEMAHESTVPLS